MKIDAEARRALEELRAENERLRGAIRFALRTYDEGHDIFEDTVEMAGILRRALFKQKRGG